MGCFTTAEIFEQSNNKTNFTSFLPYTLNVQQNNNIKSINEPVQNNQGKASNYTEDKIKTLNLYADKNNALKPLPDSNWKRFTTYSEPQPTIANQQDLRYAGYLDNICKNQNTYGHQIQFMSLIGQPVLLFIHFGILLYILFGVVAFCYRLLSLSPSKSVSSIYQDSNFY